MECKIIKKASELFLSLGFKSVTMDEIAQESGVSKKTIYQHFKNKTCLIQGCVDDIIKTINEGVTSVKSKRLNAVEEQLAVKKLIMEQLKNEKSSPHFQLERYYPNIYKTTRKKHFEIMTQCVSDNLKNGVAEGLYRADINIDVVTKMHFICAVEMKNRDIFPPEEYSVPELMNIYMENYLRSIVTPKGLEILEQQLKKR